MSDEWYLKGDGPTQIGPVTTDQIRTWLASGAVPSRSWVARPGGAWRILSEVPEFLNVPRLPQRSGHGAPPPRGETVPLAVLPSRAIATVPSPRRRRGVLLGALGLMVVALLGAGIGALVHLRTLPTVGTAMSAGIRNALTAKELNATVTYRSMLVGRYILAAHPSAGTKEWHYQVVWKDGRVAEYVRVNPAGAATDKYTVDYGIGDARTLRQTNGYGALVSVMEMTQNGEVTRTERSGRRDYENCAVLQREFDALGRVVLEKCLDSSKAPIVRENGCFVKKMEYAADSYIESELCLQDDLTPILDADGVHRTRFRRDELGRVVEVHFFDMAGSRVPRRSDGCARTRTGYDAISNVVEETCLDVSGQPQRMAGRAYSTVRSIYDDKGCWTERSHLDARGHGETLLFRQVRQCDAQCETLRFEERNEKGKRIGLAYSIVRNGEGLPVEQRCETEAGPAQCPEANLYYPGPRGSLVRWEYNERGLPISKRCYTHRGQPSGCDPARPQQQRYEFDEFGHMTVMAYFDAKGQPATWMGVGRQENGYNAFGRQIWLRYHSHNGALVNTSCGEAGLALIYDEKQRIEGIQYTDKMGKPMASPCSWTLSGVPWPHGSAQVKVLRDTGKPTRNEFYSATGKLLKTVDCSEAKAPCHQ